MPLKKLRDGILSQADFSRINPDMCFTDLAYTTS